MSVKVMAAVWDRSRATEGALLVNLAMADFAHDDGTGVYPSVATLAQKARLSERQVQRILRQLEKLGEIETVMGGGRRRTSRYTLTPGGVKMSPFSDERVTFATLKGDASVTRIISEPSLTTKMEGHKPALAPGVFAALARVCKVDPKTAGPSLGKVAKALTKAGYTPGDILEFEKWWWGNKGMRQRPPTVWKVQEQIGVIRAKKHEEEKPEQFIPPSMRA